MCVNEYSDRKKTIQWKMSCFSHICTHIRFWKKKTFLQASAYNIYNRSQPEEAFRGMS